MPSPTSTPIRLPPRDGDLISQVEQISGADLSRCYHCRGCAPVCPVGLAMKLPPHGVIRLVQFGLREEVLSSSAIWVCLGCHTCSSLCPMAIDIASIMDALRFLALEEGVTPAEPEILEFHRQVLETVEHYGRTHKLEIMLRFKAKFRNWFGDMNVGIRMLAKRKLELTASKVSAVEEVRQLFGDRWRE